ncbi:MAG: MarR family transcriptional regulator [Vulcanimicrobiaceae bacterium]
MPAEFFEKAKGEYPEADDGALRVFLALRTASRRIDNVVGGWLVRGGLTVTKFDLLHLLKWSAPEPVSIGRLRDFMRMTQPNVTFVVKALEKDGYVRWRTDPSDRRATLVSITPAGADIIATYTPRHMTAIAEAMRHLSDQRRTELVEALARIAEDFEALPEP